VHTILPLLLGRRGLLGVALIALALWTQALSPIAALRMLVAMSDPLRNPIICGDAVDGSVVAQTKVEVPASALPGCDLCQLCCIGISHPTLPADLAVIRILLWHPVSWPIPPPTSSTPPACYPGQARAPPHLA
jgi:hypothetical protein